MRKMQPRICEQCGKEFYPKDGRQIRCGDPECSRIWRQSYYVKRIEKRTGKKSLTNTCTYCGRTFDTFDPKKTCCGAPECVKAREKKNNAKRTLKEQAERKREKAFLAEHRQSRTAKK